MSDKKRKEHELMMARIKAAQELGPYIRPDHERLISRRDFISSGFMAGAGTFLAASASGLILPGMSFAEAAEQCLMQSVCGNVPFLTFDAAGGMAIAGANVMVGFGSAEDQLDFGTNKSDAYIRLGIAPEKHPKLSGMINGDFGLKFHSHSWILKGLNEVLSAEVDGNGDPVVGGKPDLKSSVDGLLLCTITSDDTGGNPLNSTYIANTLGAKGDLVQMLGTRNTDSGGNSISPSFSVDLARRPSSIGGSSAYDDCAGLISIGDQMMAKSFLDATSGGGAGRLKEFMNRIIGMSKGSLNKYSNLNQNTLVKNNIKKALDGSIDIFNTYAPADLNPDLNASDGDVIKKHFGTYDLDGNGDPDWDTYAIDSSEKQVAAISNLLSRRIAGAGTITVSGCDYHVGDGSTGNLKDYFIGRSIGQAMRMAAERGQNLFVHLYTDGAAGGDPGGAIDTSLNGDGRVNWITDSGTRSAAMILVYKHGHTRVDKGDESSDMLLNGRKRQIGYFSEGGGNIATATSISNNAASIWKAVALNYIATLVNSTDDDEVVRLTLAAFEEKFGRTAIPVDAESLIRFRSLVA